jgi:hypothetical protein
VHQSLQANALSPFFLRFVLRVVTGVKYKEKYTRELKTVNAKLTIASDGFFSSFFYGFFFWRLISRKIN